MAVTPLIYIGICLAIGLIGRERKFGIWGYFFASIVLSPAIGLLLVLGSDPTRSEVSQRLDQLAKDFQNSQAQSRGNNP